eukprot:SM000315S11904  [mRNA]  locus=s315:57278:58235:- [translate_table: standard]
MLCVTNISNGHDFSLPLHHFFSLTPFFMADGRPGRLLWQAGEPLKTLWSSSGTRQVDPLSQSCLPWHFAGAPRANTQTSSSPPTRMIHTSLELQLKSGRLYCLLVRELDLMGLRVCPSKSVAWSTRGLPANPHGCHTSANGLAILMTCGNAYKNTSPPSLPFPSFGTHRWRWPFSPAASANGHATCNG